uniref:Uncharacterized protein n=1 Tax=Globodera rostochiensis TaxID=31243 RepID=A0A914GXP1_GLORO
MSHAKVTGTEKSGLSVSVGDLLIVSNTLPSATSSALADQCPHTSRSGGGSDSICSSSSRSISNSSNSYHSAKSCGGTARCCPHCCASSVSSSPSASPSSSSAERLSPSGHPEAVVVVDSESPKSDCSSSSGSSCSSSSVIINNCTLCRQHRTPPAAVATAIEQDSRVGSEETLKRADSRLTIPRGSQSSSRSSDESQRKRPLSQRQQQQQLQQQFGEVDKLNAIVGAAAKSCSCEECVLTRQREQLQQQHDQQQQHAAGLSAGVGVSHRSSGGGGGGIAGQLSIALANAQLASGPTTSSSSGTSAQQQQQQQQMMYCNGPSTTQTIEEQIKQIDRISKECDNSRKSLEIINRRLDDLNDEVRRYREFLGHEKARRDPALYKTSNAEPLSSYNDSICRLIDSLTTQLTMEWTEKLRSIQNQTVAKFASGERG